MLGISLGAVVMTQQHPAIFGIPIDFILFGLTLVCVAVFHQHTLRVALAGLSTVALYKILFTGFKMGPGLVGFVSHVKQEWVILTNLLCLLLGFAVLSRHFEKSHLTLLLPKYLPHDWKGGLVLLGVVWVLSSFLDNIAGALIGGALAHELFRSKSASSATSQRSLRHLMLVAHGVSWAIQLRPCCGLLVSRPGKSSRR